MRQSIWPFLHKHGITEGPLLLGYSGGVDSASLLALLRKCSADVHVLHIDHRWRASSSVEACQLQKQVEALGVPFYLETLPDVQQNKRQAHGNLEDYCRQERLKLFKKYYYMIRAQALLLAHHKDDQAETIFKRVFEGASLAKLAGLKECCELHGMRVVRPLLEWTKKEVYAFARAERLTWIEDETNQEIKYLRARQREKIFPLIEQQFGKSVVKNLCRIAHQLDRYDVYMEKKIKIYREALVHGPFGSYIDLQSVSPWEEMELEYFIRKMCEHYQSTISRQALATLLLKIHMHAVNKKIIVQGLEIIIDKGCLFFLRPLPQGAYNEEIDLAQLPHLFHYQGVQWKLESVTTRMHEASWRSLWKGVVEFAGAEGDLQIRSSDLAYRLGGKSLKELYVEHKVPVFFRKGVLQIFQQDTLCCDVLLPMAPKILNQKKIFRLSIVDPL